MPLVGISLWAARRIKEQGTYHSFAFPRYTDSEYCNANSASAALNKWLKPFIPKNCVVQSLRHSFRDKLKGVECPFDVIDRLAILKRVFVLLAEIASVNSGAVRSETRRKRLPQLLH